MHDQRDLERRTIEAENQLLLWPVAPLTCNKMNKIILGYAGAGLTNACCTRSPSHKWEGDKRGHDACLVRRDALCQSDTRGS
jgi:hypothetical protein